MTESVQSGYKALPNTIKIAEKTSIDQGTVEIEHSICDIFADLNDIYADLKKLTDIMDSIPTQAEKEQENENQN